MTLKLSGLDINFNHSVIYILGKLKQRSNNPKITLRDFHSAKVS